MANTAAIRNSTMKITRVVINPVREPCGLPRGGGGIKNLQWGDGPGRAFRRSSRRDDRVPISRAPRVTRGALAEGRCCDDQWVRVTGRESPTFGRQDFRRSSSTNSQSGGTLPLHSLYGQEIRQVWSSAGFAALPWAHPADGSVLWRGPSGVGGLLLPLVGGGGRRAARGHRRGHGGLFDGRLTRARRGVRWRG